MLPEDTKAKPEEATDREASGIFYLVLQHRGLRETRIELNGAVPPQPADYNLWLNVKARPFSHTPPAWCSTPSSAPP
eukprot:1157473-Pelagomonas_calceolata.AAC.8